MACAYGCILCNRCGKLTRLLKETGGAVRICPSCGTIPPDDSSRTCAKCGAPLPPALTAAPGIPSGS